RMQWRKTRASAHAPGQRVPGRRHEDRLSEDADHDPRRRPPRARRRRGRRIDERITRGEAQGGLRRRGRELRSREAARGPRAGNGYAQDLHDFRLTSHGTALIDAYNLVRADLTAVGGPADGLVWDCVVQEIDIRTGLVLYEWHSLDHVPITDSYRRPQKDKLYDYF